MQIIAPELSLLVDSAVVDSVLADEELEPLILEFEVLDPAKAVEVAAEFVTAIVDEVVSVDEASVEVTDPSFSSATVKAVEAEAGIIQVFAPTEEHNDLAKDVAESISVPEQDSAKHSATSPDH